MLPDVVQPPEALPDDCVDDSGRSCNAGDVVSMQLILQHQLPLDVLHKVLESILWRRESV
jgi:hypothetical protein